MSREETKAEREQRRSRPISLYPLKFEEIVKDVLTIKPPKKEKRQRSGKRRDRSGQR